MNYTEGCYFDVTPEWKEKHKSKEFNVHKLKDGLYNVMMYHYYPDSNMLAIDIRHTSDKVGVPYRHYIVEEYLTEDEVRADIRLRSGVIDKYPEWFL